MSGPYLMWRGPIEAEQCDELGHLTVREYAQLFSRASWPFYDFMGFGPQAMKLRRLGFADLKHVTMFQNEIHEGETVRIYSGVTRIGNKSAEMRHVLVNEAGTPCASLDVVTVQFDLEARKSTLIPDDVRGKLEMHVVESWDIAPDDGGPPAHIAEN